MGDSVSEQKQREKSKPVGACRCPPGLWQGLGLFLDLAAGGGCRIVLQGCRQEVREVEWAPCGVPRAPECSQVCQKGARSRFSSQSGRVGDLVQSFCWSRLEKLKNTIKHFSEGIQELIRSDVWFQGAREVNPEIWPWYHARSFPRHIFSYFSKQVTGEILAG